MEVSKALKHDHYSVLDVPRGATIKELRASFKRRALAAHPDKGGSKEAFQEVALAFDVLSDPVRRSRYDRALAKRTETSNEQHRARAAAAKRCYTHSAEKRSRSPLRQQAAPSKAMPTDGAPKKQQGTTPVRPAPSATQAPPPATGGPSDKQSSSPKDAPGADARMHREPCSDAFMDKLSVLLKRLPASARRAVLSGSFSQWQRLELQAHMAKATPDATPTCGFNEDSSAPPPCQPTSSQMIVQCSEDEEDDSSLESDGADPGTEDECGVAAIAGDADVFSDIGDPDADGVTELLSLCDDSGEKVRTNVEAPRGRGASSVRYVSAFLAREQMKYRCDMTIGPLHLRTRTTTDLSTAVDYVVVLSAMKQRWVQQQTEEDIISDWRHRMHDAVECGLREHRTSAQEIGLSYYSMFWIGTVLSTPITTSLDLAVDWVQDIRSCCATSLYAEEPDVAWRKFRCTYIKMYVASRHNPVARATRIDDLEQVWLEWHYARKKCHHRAERARMSREDRRSRRFTRESRVQARVRQQISSLLHRWQRHRVAFSEASAKKAAAAAKQEAILKRQEAQERWKRMNRRDLTWEDILQRRWDS